ncbi:MAG: hypothetical protein JWR80_1050 [Bradyrhizobium sp.]|nr:hypothetical protein [Bradyrhizobium sp.]
MKIKALRLVGIRAFEDTGVVQLSETCNIFVGENNAGKSTILKCALSFQGFTFGAEDIRPHVTSSYYAIVISGQYMSADVPFAQHRSGSDRFVYKPLLGPHPSFPEYSMSNLDQFGAVPATRPRNFIVPFLAKRKAVTFEQNVSLGSQIAVTGTFSNLYSRIDLLATVGHPNHDDFQRAIREIVGVPITTRAAPHGKEAGFYFDASAFVSLERMGDGVSEMVALIVELCLEKGKVFVLEEPETNLHPRGLRALLSLVRASMKNNQFLIATHSNVVIRDLAFDEQTKIFRIAKSGAGVTDPSEVAEVARDPVSHASLLRELGYEFADMGLHEAWVFLEESSAEYAIQDFLIPTFVPELAGRIRTFAAGGVTNLEPTLSDFQRLTTFLHLQPVYRGKLWIRADGDVPGREVISKIREKFSYLTEDECKWFEEEAFERYYPQRFAEKVGEALAVPDKQRRRAAKTKLLLEVVEWSNNNKADAATEWASSASEIIDFLRLVSNALAFPPTAERPA